MIGTSPICMDCQHHRGDLTCDAFPKGIPEKIIFSEWDHTKPVEGDNGIQFELKTKGQ